MRSPLVHVPVPAVGRDPRPLVRASLTPVLAVAAVAGVARALTVAGLELYTDEAYYWVWSRSRAR
jgi:hypothetical protein